MRSFEKACAIAAGTDTTHSWSTARSASAIDAMSDALDNFEVEGIGHNLPFLSAVMRQERFRAGRLTTAYIAEEFPDGFTGVAPDDHSARMLAAIAALQKNKAVTPVDIHFLFTVGEEVGVGASSILVDEVASMIAIDNGTTAPGQNSDEFGVTIAMADQTGPFDYHLTKKMVELCQENEIRYQKDIFKYYQSDSASALTAGADVRTALVTFGVDSSHGYERIHLHALRSLAELVTAYVRSPVEIKSDFEQTLHGTKGFTKQSLGRAEQELSPDVEDEQLGPQT